VRVARLGGGDAGGVSAADDVDGADQAAEGDDVAWRRQAEGLAAAGEGTPRDAEALANGLDRGALHGVGGVNDPGKECLGARPPKCATADKLAGDCDAERWGVRRRVRRKRSVGNARFHWSPLWSPLVVVV